MMKKKIIGLSMLLLVLLLGLSSTSYANITESQLKNFIYNWSLNKGLTQSYAEEFFNSQTYTTLINRVGNYLDNDNYNICIYTSGFNVYIVFFNQNQGKLVVTNKTDLSGRLVDNISPYQQIQVNNYNYNNTQTSDSWVNIRYNSNYMYSDVNLYDGWGTTIYANAPFYYPNSSILEGPYQDALPFSFIPRPSTESAEVYYFDEVPLYNASSEDLYIGQLYMPTGTNIIYWTKDNYYYRYNDWNIRQLPNDSFYLDYVGSDEDGSLYDVYLQKQYIYENTIYSSVWADGSTEPYTLAVANFYIKNNNTIVINGVISPGNTFSGDYKDKYDNDIDNQEDISNIISGTEPILDFLSNTDISSGDEPTFNDLPSIEIDDDSEEFFTWLLQKFLIVLNDNSNNDLTIPLFNNNYSISSDFYVLDIEPLRTFINLGWWFICGVPFLKFIRSSIEKLKGGNIPLADEKSDLLGHII